MTIARFKDQLRVFILTFLLLRIKHYVIEFYSDQENSGSRWISTRYNMEFGCN